MNLDYFYVSDMPMYDYIVIPRALIVKKPFTNLNGDSKLLYALMMDRLKVSVKNGLIDEENRVYLIFSVSEICELLNVGNQKATKLLKELEDSKLIERRRFKRDIVSWYYLKRVDFYATDEEVIERKNANIEKNRNYLKRIK